MKKTNLFISLPVLLFSLSLQAQIQQDCNGNVGFGMAPISGGKVFVNGVLRIYAGNYSDLIINGTGYDGPGIVPESDYHNSIGWTDKRLKYVYVWDCVETSDARLKDNVRNVTGALDRVLQLNPVKYDIKREFALKDIESLSTQQKELFEKERKDHFGFLAQEVQTVIPEVVQYDETTDAYGIKYSRFIPLLVEAIKEQQIIIDELKAEISASKFKSTSQNLTSGNLQEYNNELMQNTPNPFSEITYISYKVNENVVNAMICIYNLNGEQIRNIPVPDRGNSSVSLSGSELKAGIYLYSLIADGVVIDTKRMVLTD